MMVAVLAAMSVAFVAGRWGPRWLAFVAVLLALTLASGLFLWEVHSPVDGWHMPWLQVRGGDRPGAEARA